VTERCAVRCGDVVILRLRLRRRPTLTMICLVTPSSVMNVPCPTHHALVYTTMMTSW